MKKTAFATACALVLAGCAHVTTHHASLSAMASARLNQAAIAVKDARVHGALWLATPHLLAVARTADTQGHYGAAIKAANTVILQCQTAERQAVANAHAKPYYPPLA
ncbi:hypothetical protein [Acidiferrobacter sp.]|uniref:hypothetical protein n=1 Tax=Acidiferrobacter sp. TaxID=1872107 RepID=UPI00261D714E|nr:hypothetical protein [Acidiferrobacter sp.]